MLIVSCYHGKDRSRIHVLHKAGKERLGGQVSIVLLKMCSARLKKHNVQILLNYCYYYCISTLFMRRKKKKVRWPQTQSERVK